MSALAAATVMADKGDDFEKDGDDDDDDDDEEDGDNGVFRMGEKLELSTTRMSGLLITGTFSSTRDA